jgi:hypothetical protein
VSSSLSRYDTVGKGRVHDFAFLRLGGFLGGFETLGSEACDAETKGGFLEVLVLVLATVVFALPRDGVD